MPDNNVVAEPAERELLRTRLHWGILLVPFFMVAPLAVVLGLPLLAMRYFFIQAVGQAPPLIIWAPLGMLALAAAAAFLPLWIAFLCTDYVLTTQRLRFRTGWLLRASGELRLKDIETILLVEPFLGQILGYEGVVVVGKGGTQIPLRFIPSNQGFHARLKETRDAVRGDKPLPPGPPPLPAAPARPAPRSPAAAPGPVVPTSPSGT